jgi:NitT/TauT family transport system permease protein
MTAAVERVRHARPGVLDRLGARALRALPAAVVFVVFVAAWEVSTGGEAQRIFPAPSAILGAFLDQQAMLLASARNTFFEALGGLVIGTLAGTLVAFGAARFITVRDVLLPFAIAASAIPLIAVAPILNNWFGVVNPLSKMMMAALLVFFPVMVSVIRGLVEVPPAALELMRSYASSDTEVLRKVRLPNMLPFFFTALKVSTTLSFIGAIVAEYFGGTSEVLGRVVITSMFSGRFALAWAGILIGAVAAILAYLVVTAIERVAIPWYISMRGEES